MYIMECDDNVIMTYDRWCLGKLPQHTTLLLFVIVIPVLCLLLLLFVIEITPTHNSAIIIYYYYICLFIYILFIIEITPTHNSAINSLVRTLPPSPVGSPAGLWQCSIIWLRCCDPPTLPVSPSPHTTTMAVDILHTRNFFLRCMCAIYMFAFGSLYLQVPGECVCVFLPNFYYPLVLLQEKVSCLSCHFNHIVGKTVADVGGPF